MEDQRPGVDGAEPDALEDERAQIWPWSPAPDDHDRWRRRVQDDLRPLIERCERLRDRGLLE